MFVHRRVNPVAGRLLGASVIERHAMQVGVAGRGPVRLAVVRRRRAPVGAAGQLGDDVVPRQAETVKSRWKSLFQGTREPAVLGKGWDWKPIQITPNESQFLETQRFTGRSVRGCSARRWLRRWATKPAAA